MRKAISAVLIGLSIIAAAVLFMSTALSAYNTIGRVAFTTSLAWIEELCCYTAGFIMFLMLPFLEYNDRHLSIAFLDEKFKTTGNIIGRRIIFYIRGVITIVVFCILTRAGYNTFMRNFAINSKSPTMELPYGILYFVLFVCVVLVVALWVFHFFLKKWETEGGEKIEFD